MVQNQRIRKFLYQSLQVCDASAMNHYEYAFKL